MPIIVLGLNHRTAPLEIRERFAFPEGRIPEALQRLRDAGRALEAVILSTCNRVEIYAAVQEPRLALDGLRQFLENFHGLSQTLHEEVYALSEPQSIHHLFRVACGLDSMVLGETEILGQLKRAYDLALRAGHTGPALNKAFQRGFNVAKQIRSTTSIQRGNVSVASVAVELAEKIFTTLTGRDVLVIGAGETSEKTARALVSRGAGGIIVSNRSHERASALAAELGGRAIRFEELSSALEQVDVVISSTSAPHYILDRSKVSAVMKTRRNRPILLMDIAVPRDIEPEVNLMDHVFLCNIDDLQATADEYMNQRKLEIEHCESIIRQKAAALLGHDGAAGDRPAVRPAFS